MLSVSVLLRLRTRVTRYRWAEQSPQQPPCYTVPMNEIQQFLPGDGQLPPHLAGREAEQTILREFLGWLQGRVTIPP